MHFKNNTSFLIHLLKKLLINLIIITHRATETLTVTSKSLTLYNLFSIFTNYSYTTKILNKAVLLSESRSYKRHTKQFYCES